MTKLFFALLSLVTAVSCYSAGGDGDGTGGAAAGGTGAQGNGGSPPRGGSTSRGGTFFGGSGGTLARGGSGGSTAGSGGTPHCSDSSDCGQSSNGSFECVPPGATPLQSDSCGAIDWCGQCSCGPQPQQPYGTGSLCDDVTPCPTADTVPGFESYASLCDSLGQCTVCELDEHCPLELPRCATARTGSGNECFECVDNLDCPELLPYCVPLEAAFQTYTPGGTCRECQSAADCAIGICIENACQPQCTTTEDCGNAFLSCSAEQRCVASPCTTTAECPEYGACLDGGCVRMICASDIDCGGGACVNGGCYASLGSCVEHFYYP